jgi:hypothetical protein
MAKSKSEMGDKNVNRQRLVAKTHLPGTDHNQYVWHLHCETCDNDYGANGSDFHHRKCPKCQSGAPGLDFDQPQRVIG